MENEITVKYFERSLFLAVNNKKTIKTVNIPALLTNHHIHTTTANLSTIILDQLARTYTSSIIINTMSMNFPRISVYFYLQKYKSSHVNRLLEITGLLSVLNSNCHQLSVLSKRLLIIGKNCLEYKSIFVCNALAGLNVFERMKMLHIIEDIRYEWNVNVVLGDDCPLLYFDNHKDATCNRNKKECLDYNYILNDIDNNEYSINVSKLKFEGVTINSIADSVQLTRFFNTLPQSAYMKSQNGYFRKNLFLPYIIFIIFTLFLIHILEKHISYFTILNNTYKEAIINTFMLNISTSMFILHFIFILKPPYPMGSKYAYSLLLALIIGLIYQSLSFIIIGCFVTFSFSTFLLIFLSEQEEHLNFNYDINHTYAIKYPSNRIRICLIYVLLYFPLIIHMPLLLIKSNHILLRILSIYPTTIFFRYYHNNLLNDNSNSKIMNTVYFNDYYIGHLISISYLIFSIYMIFRKKNQKIYRSRVEFN